MAEVLFTNTDNAAEDRRVRRLAEEGQLRRIVPRVTAYDPEVPIEWRNGVPAPRSYWEAVSRDSSVPWL